MEAEPHGNTADGAMRTACIEKSGCRHLDSLMQARRSVWHSSDHCSAMRSWMQQPVLAAAFVALRRRICCSPAAGVAGRLTPVSTKLLQHK